MPPPKASIGRTAGHALVTMTPAGFGGFFAEVGNLTPGRHGDFQCVGDMAARCGLEFLPSA